MLGHTHALIGLTTLAAANALTGFIQPHLIGDMPTGPVLCAGAAILGALLPDLDAEASSIQQDLGVVGQLARWGLRLVGIRHRGVLHSGLVTLLVMIGSGLIGRWFGYFDVGLALGLGYLSHVVLADALTLSGVPLFWPLSYRFHLLPRILRVRTGGPVEKLIFIVAMLILIWLIPTLVSADVINGLLLWISHL